MSALFFTSSKLYHTICRMNQKKARKRATLQYFFKRDGNSRNTITFAGKNLCHFALSLFFLLFRLGFSQPKCIYSV